VQTRYGYVRTDHILFIAAGAFHIAKPSDLIPSCRAFPDPGRAVIADRGGFRPHHDGAENALTSSTRRCAPRMRDARVHRGRVKEIARIAAKVNERMENIGARRLHTVLTTLLEDVLFELPDYPTKHIVFDGRRCGNGCSGSSRTRPAPVHPVAVASALFFPDPG